MFTGAWLVWFSYNSDNNAYLFHLQLSLACPLPGSWCLQMFFEMWVGRKSSTWLPVPMDRIAVSHGACDHANVQFCAMSLDQKTEITQIFIPRYSSPFSHSKSKTIVNWSCVNAALAGSASSTASLNTFSAKAERRVQRAPIAKWWHKASLQLYLN